MSATASATASAVPHDWLTVDQTAAQRGYGPAEYGDPMASPAPPVVPTAVNPLGPGAPVTAPGAPGTMYDGDGSGAWPALPGSGDGRIWLDRGDGFPQGLFETQAPNTDGPGMWNDSVPYQTWDALSQHTDTAGWAQNVPNGRQSARNTFGQSNPLNNPTWYGYGENPALAHLAISAVPYTADVPAGRSPGFSNGQLPDWTATGGQGSTAYETPAPPPASAAPATAVFDPAAGWA